MTSRFTGVIPTLRIFDSAKAREFYIDFLGFKVDFEHRFEPDLPLFMQVSMGDVVLYLSEHHGDCSPGAKIVIETTGLAGQSCDKILLERKPQILAPGLRFRDLEPLHDRLQAAADGLDFGQFGHVGAFTLRT